MSFQEIQSAIEELTTLMVELPREWEAISADDAARLRTDGGWSRKQIVGHLIDSATVNHQRFVRVLAGETGFSLLYAQEKWVELNGYQDRDWEEVLGLWSVLNGHVLQVCRRIGAEHAELVCGHGEDDNPWTLSYRVPDYVDHMKMHVEQIRRGPWV